MNAHPEISVVIPVYRSESILRDLYARLAKSLEQLQVQFEVLFVEDCGGDKSWDIIKTLVRSDSRVRGFRMSRNYGQHNAVLCGIRAARGDVTITMDDDLQHPPEELQKLLDKLREGYDVVYGTPDTPQHGVLRNWASRVTKLALQDIMGVEVARNVSALRAFQTNLRDAFASYRSPSVSIDILLTWATQQFAAVTVRHEPRTQGESGYTIGKLIKHALNMMTGFSTMPLQVASIAGFVFALFGFLVLAYVVGRYLLEGTGVPGFPFLASIIAIFSGVQLFALGIMGEYLARMNFRALDRPVYSVREIVEHEREREG
jgi:undecaprenyl-phosphate 4-deoxy-4-formamido-L-arabinose transferase